MDTGNSNRGVDAAGKTTEALEVLGLLPDAAELEIRFAYRAWAKLFHPDHISKDRAFQHQVLVARFKLIATAYEHLSAADGTSS